MRKIFFLLVLALTFSGLNNNALGQFPEGDGSSGNPYQVANAADLNEVRNHLSNGTYFIQTANIDLSGYGSGDGWDPIGNDADNQRFRGNYDGNGYNISNLFINRSAEPEVGLFGCIGRGTEAHPVVIQNVELINVQNITGARGTGSLVGRVRGDVYTLIENSSASGSGTLKGNGATGGLVGANNSYQETPGGTDNPTVSQCWANINVEGVTGGGGDKIGGLVGCNQKGNTVDCFARGSVTVPASGTFLRIGGLAGCTDLRGSITRSFSTGHVNTNNNPNATLFGGLVGHLGNGGNAGVVNNSYWDTETSQQTGSAGGTGYTTTQMQQQSNLTGFDFTNTWDIDGSTNNGYPFLRNVDVTSYINWTGATNNTWNNTGNWDVSRLPIYTDIVVIPDGLTNYPVITSSENLTATAKLVDIIEGGSITINPTGKFEVNADLRSETTGLIIESDNSGTGSLLHNSERVNATIERYVTGSTNLEANSYHTVSVPLTQDANPLSGLFLGSYLYEFDAENQVWNALGTPTNTQLYADKGYLIYYPASSKTYSFSGPMNNGAFDAATMSTTSGDHQLVPNPYPSAIDWDAGSGWTKTNLYDAIWVWNASSGSWASYVGGTGANNGSNIVPVGQSFMVQSSAASPSLSMDNQVRLHSNQGFLKITGDDINVLRIKAITQNYSDEIVLKYHESATENFDGNWDAAKLYGLGDSPQLYSYSDDNYKLSINSIPPVVEDKTIQLGFELSVPETVRLEFSSMDSFGPETSIILLDDLTGGSINVRTNPEYVFMSDPENDPLRFKVQIKNATSVQEFPLDDFVAYFSGQQLYFNTPGQAMSASLLQVFNTSGQLIFSDQVASGQQSIPLPGLSSGIYVVKLTHEKGIFTSKVSYQEI